MNNGEMKMKNITLKIFALFLTAVIFLSGFIVTHAGLLGDIDNSGSIESSDARTVLRASVGLESLSDEQQKTADVDNDNIISSSDARLILRMSVGLEDLIFTEDNSYFQVHFIDVGQADSALIICDNESLLIDGGNVSDSDEITEYLSSQNITTLDYVICTHAHEDHVGGLGGILEHFTVTERIFAPETESSSKCYTDFVNAVHKQSKTVSVPQHGMTISLGSAEILFAGPVHENYSDINNTSIVTKITYGETSFLFTGDAERESELDILSSSIDISADVLKVGHHGGETSTTYPFLREIMPEIAVFSVGINNYGHPTEAVLSRLRDADVKVYRTDLQGNIIITSNGNTLNVETEKNKHIETNPTEKPESQTYIGNKNSLVFHIASCSSLPKEENRIYFSDRNSATSNGYTPCKKCSP